MGKLMERCVKKILGHFIFSSQALNNPVFFVCVCAIVHICAESKCTVLSESFESEKKHETIRLNCLLPIFNTIIGHES